MSFRFFKRSTADFITVVSGLPRSGTSMMMRMLETGGMSAVIDHIRVPDESNPKGYYEFERVKQLQEGNTEWVAEGKGKVVKIISALLEHLPPEHQYRIVFMKRNMSEILASQREMLLRRGEPTDRISDQELTGFYEDHLARIAEWLAARPNMQVLYLQYNQIMENPQTPVAQLCQFLQPIPLDPKKMLSVVEASLYRQRALTTGDPVQQI